MKRYGPYCPVARAAKILAERWTLLVIRELLCGSDRFNVIARGVPRMSPTLLAARLRELQRAGLVLARESVDVCDSDAARALPAWLGVSPFAAVELAPSSLPR